MSGLSACVAAVLAILVAAPPGLAATDSTWKGYGGSWSDPAKWLSGIPNGVDDVARIPVSNNSGQSLTIDAGVPGGGVTLGSLFWTNGYGYPYSVDASAGMSLTFDVSGGSALIQVDGTGQTSYLSAPIVLSDSLTLCTNNGYLALTGSLSSAVLGTGLTKTGTGTAALDALVNRYDGPTVVSAGTLAVEYSGGLGVGGRSVTVADGARLQASSTTPGDAIWGKRLTVQRTGVGGYGALELRFRGTVWAGSITLVGDMLVQTYYDGTILGPLQGPGKLTKSDVGSLTLKAPGTRTGATEVANGYLVVADSTALGVGAAPVTVDSAATLMLNGGVTVSGKPITLNGTGYSDNSNVYYGALHGAAGSSQWDGPVHLATNSVLAADGILTVSGVIDGGFSLTAGKSWSDTGAVVLTGANQYTGSTSVASVLEAQDGVGLPAASNLGLQTAAVFQGHGPMTFTRGLGTGAGQFQWTSFSGGFAARGGKMIVNLGGHTTPDTLVAGTTPSFLSAGGSFLFGSTSADSEVEVRNPINLGGGLLYFNVADNPASGGDVATLSGLVSNGAITKVGLGTLALTGANTYTGQTKLQGGALRATDGVGLPTASNIYFNGGVFEGNGPTTFTRSLGTGAGQIQWPTTACSGGFSAHGGKMTVSLNGNATLVLGGTPYFMPSTYNPSALDLGSATADSETEFRNPVNMSGNNFLVYVADNPGTDADFATLSGGFSNGNLCKYDKGTLVLTAQNTYSGWTSIAEGALRATNGVGLPTASNLILNGSGVFEGNGATTFTRPLGTGAGQIQMTQGGGFSAHGGKMTVNIGGAATPQTLVWGTTPNFLVEPFSSDPKLLFGSTTANAETEWRNPIDLGGKERKVQVADNPYSNQDLATLTGILSNGSLRKMGPGTLVLNARESYTGSTTVAEGTLRIGTNGSLASTVVNVLAGATLDAGAGATLPAGTTLTGTGRTTGALTVLGTVAPGSSPGILTLEQVVLGNGSRVQIELSEVWPGTGYDVLSALNLLIQDGATLSVSTINQFHPNKGDVFDILSFTGLSGAFTTVDLPALDPGLTWDAQGLYTRGELRVTPEPATLFLVAAGALTLLRRRRDSVGP